MGAGRQLGGAGGVAPVGARTAFGTRTFGGSPEPDRAEQGVEDVTVVAPGLGGLGLAVASARAVAASSRAALSAPRWTEPPKARPAAAKTMASRPEKRKTRRSQLASPRLSARKVIIAA